MIITLKNPNGSMNVDTDKVFDRCIKGFPPYVRTFDKEDRIKLIEFLESRGFWCIEDNTRCRTDIVETCVLLVRELADDDEVVSIKVDLDGISLNQGEYIPPAKPTYKNIKQWIEENYGFKVSTLYIAQIKDKVGLEKRKNYNPGSGEGKVPVCPPDKEEAIMDAFRHFNLI